jgi:APA family basic amino acid/polyamine antiporter
VLVAWAIGAVFALLGTQAYGALAAHSGRSGGEYQLLSEHLHPAVGWTAGWASLLLGFSAPIAVDALAVGAYAAVLAPDLVDPRLVATLTVLALAGVHSADHRSSRWAQDALLVVKGLLLVGFVLAGLALGSRAWPTWASPGATSSDLPWGAILDQQYWVAFAFSGWNAAVYVAGEFKSPKRDVPRAMLLGCGLVGVLYLLLNYVFVANLSPLDIPDPTRLSRGGDMLGHVVALKLLGPVGGTIMSAVTLLVFLSATSAMILAGPRVVASMAADGALPAVFRARHGHPPRAAAWLQAGVALLLVWTQSLREAVDSTSSVLLLFTGLVAVAAARLPTARPGQRLAGGAYALFAGFLLVRGITEKPHVAWILGLALVALALRSFLTSRAPR